MKNKKINEQLKHLIKDYVVLMVNPDYKDSDFEYYGINRVNFLRKYIDENKQEIDIKALKDYLNVFGIKIFDKDIVEIEKQLAFGNPEKFEDDLELLFKEKVFASYGGNIYDIPEIAEYRMKKILKKYKKPMVQLVDKDLLARLANTTATVLLQKGETDEGYRFESTYKMGINFLALETIKNVLENTSEKIEDYEIGNNKPFDSSINANGSQKIHKEDNSSKTIFEILSKTVGLYRSFQYGESYDFSENYYSTGLEVINLCLSKMIIIPELIKSLKPELKEIKNFIQKSEGLNTQALAKIDEQYKAICKTLGMSLEIKEKEIKEKSKTGLKK